MKKLIIGGLIILVGISVGSYKVATNMVSSNSAKSKVVAVNEIAEEKTAVLAKPVIEKVDSQKAATRIEIITEIHEMANTLIIAEDNKIWGRQIVTKDSVSQLLNILNTSKPFEEKETFIAIAKKWKSGDFANIVYDHNTVWKMLDGTIGRADEPNIEAVAQAKAALK